MEASPNTETNSVTLVATAAVQQQQQQQQHNNPMQVHSAPSPELRINIPGWWFKGPAAAAVAAAPQNHVLQPAPPHTAQSCHAKGIFKLLVPFLMHCHQRLIRGSSVRSEQRSHLDPPKKE
jgi:hypothetical protein